MDKPLLVSATIKHDLPILIIDKPGILGSGVAHVLQEEFVTVFVTSKHTQRHKNTIHVPFHKKVPHIPDSIFSLLFVVYAGEPEVLQFLPTLIKKAQQANAPLFFITSVRHVTEPILRHVTDSYSHVKVIVVGDVFGSTPALHNPVTRMVLHAKKYGVVRMPGDGLQSTYPISMDHTVAGIMKVAFGNLSEKVLLLLPHHPVTSLSLARLLKNSNPLLQLDFLHKETERSPLYVPTHGTYLTEASYAITDGLKQLLEEPVDDMYVSPAIHEEKRMRRRNWFAGKLPLVLLSIVIVFTAPFIAMLGSAGVGTYSLYQGKSAFMKGDMATAQTWATRGYNAFGFASDMAVVPVAVTQTVVGEKHAAGLRTQLQTGREVAESMQTMSLGVMSWKRVFAGESREPKVEFLVGLNAIKRGITLLQTMQAEDRMPKELQQVLAPVSGSFTLLGNTLDTFPTVFGFTKKQSYLVLFQNNMELRPGGGFIGSYGLLDVENGKVGEFTIHDVYDLDGQFKEDIEPPFALRRYLGASHWYLRDSNFDVDFAESAANAAFFYDKEAGKKVDGVIAVDVTLLREVLKVLGPIEVPEYKQTINAENFFLVTEGAVQEDFFPGSTQKKDFLKAFYRALMNTLVEKGKQDVTGLVGVGVKGIEEKHLLVAFADQGMQRIFSLNKFSSSLQEQREPETQTHHDFFGVNEANLGENKVNYYLKRDMTYVASLRDDGQVRSTATMTYTNTSTATSPFGGAYKSYVRFLLPKDATIASLVIDGEEQETIEAITRSSIYLGRLFTPPQELEVEETEEQGKKVYGFLMIVPAGSTKKVTITYTTPSTLSEDTTTYTYDLLLFKQPGTDADAYNVTVFYPQAFKPFQLDMLQPKQAGEMTASGVLNTDKNLRMTLVK